MRRDLPSGTVTFLFTDVEGSTKLLHEVGVDEYDAALADHRRIIRDALTRHGGIEVDTQGDAFFVAFPTAAGAVAAAAEARDRLTKGRIRVRMGLHTGTPRLSSEGYIGPDVHKGARIAAAGHGGQILLSKETRELVQADVTELGEHRLKDLEAAVVIFQLGSDRFPPLKTISNTNLPRPASSFVGRKKEVKQIVLQLTDSARVLTLTGPGGTGKTRLALEAAAELVGEFKAGVFWVPLAPLRDAALVIDTIAHTLGAKDGVQAHVGEREMLLLLDNLEQVVDAAPDLARLVEACPNLRLLITSRERLRIRGEVEYPVPPLAEPAAVELFCDRARVEPDETARALCGALDNLPLALELAAARASVLSPRQILDRLSKRLDLLKGGRDADPRQHTLRATIDWSHSLLSEDEQRLFAHLAVFRGGWTLETAEEVAEGDLDTLQSLVDKSLVRHRDGRFSMLETIHQFALERLERSTLATATRSRHAQFFLHLAERAYQHRFTSAARWFQVMDDELDNLRAALDWVRDASPEIEAQLAGAVAYYWSLRANIGEARERLSFALRRYTAHDRVRARALVGLGSSMGMDRAALPVLEEALSIYGEQGDAQGEALALEAIAYKYIGLHHEGAARKAFEQSLALSERAGATDIERWYAMGGLCQLLIAAGEATRAEPMAQNLLQLGERHANLDAQGDALHYLADCALLSGDFVEAERRYVRALRHAYSCGIAGQSVEELRGVAMAAAGQGEHRRAVRLAALAAAEREALDMPPLSPDHWWGRLQERFIGGAWAKLPPGDAASCERAGREADFKSVVEDLIGVTSEVFADREGEGRRPPEAGSAASSK